MKKNTPTAEAKADLIARLAMGERATPLEQEALFAVAETYRKIAARSAGPVIELPDMATPQEVSRARRSSAVRLGKDVYLPSWKELVTALPNSLLRSALWSVRAIGFGGETGSTEHPLTTLEQDDKVGRETRIPALGDVTLINRGPALGYYDRQVFANCLDHYRDDRPLSPGGDSSWVQVSYFQFLKSMGVSYNKDSHRSVRASLERLSAMSLHVRHAGLEVQVPRVLEVSFFDGASRLEELKSSDLILFRILEPIAQLYGPMKWTRVPRTALTAGKGLRSWLASFYATHRKPFPLNVSALHELSGSAAPLSKFRFDLKTALEDLSSPTTPDEVRIRSYQFDAKNTTVSVQLTSWESS